jgi:hypothetical protein
VRSVAGEERTVNRSVMLAIGVFLVVGSVYGAAGPGRLDIIDGQYRFEVARNLLHAGSLQIRDPFLLGAAEGLGGRYSPYGISGSIVSLPLVIIGTWIDPSSIERQQFFFSFTSALFGAGTAAVLLFFYLTLGVSPGSALRWTLVAAFATLAFPASTSVFEQAQHGFFVVSACLLAFLGARRDSMALTIAGGLMLAVLVNFQETYIVLFPALGLATLASRDGSIDLSRRAIVRYLMFVLAGALGLLVYAGVNDLRFGHPLATGKGTNHPSAFGNPLLGLPALLVSPGKSILLYSPPIVLALIGVRELLRREHGLALAISLASLAHLAVISSVSFFGGDWCWGPRYFVPILPLLALGFPMVGLATTGHRAVVPAIVAAGVVVQLLAISLDHHRFFYARSLPAFFWHGNEGFYFRESALWARPGEILDSIRHGVPAEAQTFRPGPNPDLLTYPVFGPGERESAPPVWMRHYRVFWLPRPWPLWMLDVAPEKRPIPVEASGLFCLVGVMGLLVIRAGLRSAPVTTLAFSVPSDTR